MSAIAAIATPTGAGGLSVVRISGDSALAVASCIFVPASGRTVASMKGYSACYGRVRDREGRDIDEAVLLIFRAPHSYTGEDTAEISCHGGRYVTESVLRAALDAGAAPASAGEFTKRAFLAGKLSLTQAEAIADLIAAQGRQAADAALAARDGALAARLAGMTEELLAIAAEITAWVDFPEEDTPAVSKEALLPALVSVSEGLQELLKSYDAGRILREGVDAVIVGKPNVGKSTLMNLLAGHTRSIVTPVPGTTRDIVEESILVGGVPLRLADTAGLRDTEDEVEGIGVRLARERLARAGLLLVVLDGSEPLTQEDRALLEQARERPSVVVINKADLEQKLPRESLCDFPDAVYVSAREGQGAELLHAAIARVLHVAGLDPKAAMLSNERQRSCAVRAYDALHSAAATLREGFSLDAVNIDLDDALDALLELAGKRVSEEVVNEVFSRFCVGK